MKLKQLLNDDDAVSPVIGVILMVAITVILAAVIATFVLGLGEQVSDTAPQASFSYTTSGGNITVTHDGGATLQNDSVSIKGDVERLNTPFPTEIAAGDTAEVNVTSGEGTIRIIWTNDAGTDTATLSKYDYDTS
ncbi:type IV pilin N-terminal domain-containing protein [Salinibaculum rarum]|uniref:type IV pilin N-terminal domain-containing protein n=1 Tax=Salinibaculum rarum TaxID=3058903 RepID=UPI00265F6C66|nr:type IV pilin N-terminal domain-containing protein [Salinibaculum sp. KK48]